MNEILWKIADVSWLVTFEILLSTALRIPLIGATFIPILLLFTWLFSRTVPKFGSSWIVWAIPYTFSVTAFLSFFAKENLFTFMFKTFWLSLASWFSFPVSPFAMAVLLFAISYVMAYLTAHLVKNTLNTFIVLAISATIAGIATQYCCLPISFGFMLLFVLSLALNGRHEEEKITRPFLVVIMITVVMGSIFFFVGTYFKPSVPLEHLFIFKTPSSQSVPVYNGSAPLVKNNIAAKIPTRKIPESREILQNGKAESVLFEIIVDVVGILIIGVGVAAIIGMFFLRGKRKKKTHWKSVIYAVWTISSAFFLLMLIMYAFGILNFKTNRTFAGSISHLLGNGQSLSGLPSSLSSTSAAALPSQGGTFLEKPIIWITLAVIGLVIILYMAFKFIKDVRPIGENKKDEGNVEKNFDKSKKAIFSGKPWQTVLFYYNLLRDNSVKHSATPSEFEEVLEGEMSGENARKVTKIFVKLRYAHSNISEKEARFVKEQVIRVLNTHT